MSKRLLSDRLLSVLLVLALLVKLFSLNAGWVERYYTYGFYPFISRFERLVFGWIPFSMGDLLYTGAGIFLALKLWKLLRLLFQRRLRTYLNWAVFRKYLRLALWIYLIFNICWGLNYDRQGIAAQLGLQVRPYTAPELLQLTQVLHDRINAAAALEDTVRRQALDHNTTLFAEGARNYGSASLQYPFLAYHTPSVKPSIFSSVAHYFGFSGYLNPFTGEAQLNTIEPVYVKPFVVDHEIAHQLGYGKENEANFVSFLACRRSANIDFRYSLYYELYFDAVYEYAQTRDTAALMLLKNTLHPRVRRDRLDELAFRLKRKNGFEPYVSGVYDRYLQLNKQPHGLATYNEVTAWLIAYGKKFGFVSL